MFDFASPKSLPASVALFADDQIVAGLQIACDDFGVGVVVETEIDDDRFRLSSAQHPQPPCIARRSGLFVDIGAGRVVDGRIAQLLIGRAKKIVAPVDLDAR